MDYDQYGNPIQTQLGQFMGHPGTAMAAQAIQNMMLMRRGQMSPINPVMAYNHRQGVMDELQMKRDMLNRRNELHQLQLQKARQDLDPMFAFNNFVTQRGLQDSPYEDQLDAFRDFSSAASTGSSRRIAKTFTGENGNMWYLDSVGTPVDTGIAASPGGREIIDVGGVPYVKTTSPGGEEGFQTLDEFQRRYRTDSLSGEKYAENAGASQEKMDAEFRNAAASLPDMEAALQDTVALRDAIRSGQFQKTGFFEGRVFRMTDEETAKLAAKQVMQILKNLQITNLAPVTEKEIALIEDLYASVLKDPAANIGALEAAIEMMQSKIEGVNRMGQYFVNNGNTLRDFGIAQRWRAPADDDPEVDF